MNETDLDAVETAVAKEVDAIDAENAIDEAMNAWKNAELVPRPEQLPQADAWQRMIEMARFLCRSPLMPKHIRDSKDPEADAVVILLAAHDLGLSATVAFQKLIVIDGKLTMSAEAMRMLVRRDEHDMWTEVERDEMGRPQIAHAYGIRKEHPDRTHEATFSIEDAVIGGLCKVNAEGSVIAKDNQGRAKPWEKYTEDMLVARATSRLCRRVFEDALAGVSYTPEELGVIEVDSEAESSYVPCSEAVRENLLAQIAELSDEARSLVRDRWKEQRLRPLQSAKQPTLSTDELPIAVQLLADVKRDVPEEAEVILAPPHPYAGNPGSDEPCATCDRAETDPLHAAPEAAEPVSAAPAVRAAPDPLETPSAGPVAAEITAWAGRLPAGKVREALIQSGKDISGPTDKLRERLARFTQDVKDGIAVDQRRCKTCNGYEWTVPPGLDACSCPI